MLEKRRARAAANLESGRKKLRRRRTASTLTRAEARAVKRATRREVRLKKKEIRAAAKATKKYAMAKTKDHISKNPTTFAERRTGKRLIKTTINSSKRIGLQAADALGAVARAEINRKNPQTTNRYVLTSARKAALEKARRASAAARKRGGNAKRRVASAFKKVRRRLAS